jgi:hypothetical protein
MIIVLSFFKIIGCLIVWFSIQVQITPDSLKNAFVPNSVKDKELIVLGNSFYLEKMISEYLDPDRNKCSNKHILDSLIANSTNDFQVLFKVNIRP